MCGFYFQYNKTKSKFINSNEILELLSHRGPDASGIYKNDNILAIHTLLKIQDISDKSIQPFSIIFGKKKFNIIYNGEIYNKSEIKEKITQTIKYQFKTDGDTELFLLSFIIWGENFIKKIEGMFAYVIWEEKNQKIYFGRDLFMQKPLYYLNTKKYLILSSEIKPILQAAKLYKEKISFNKKSIIRYFLTNNFSNDKYTFFNSINQLKGGYIGSQIKKKITIKKCLNLKKPNKIKTKVENIYKFEKFSEIVVNQHLVGKVKTGIALSSGADSSYLLYLINKNKKISKNLTAFTFAFENFKNEFKDAKKICKKLNINHEVVYLKTNELFEDFQELIKYNEFPIGGLPTLAMYRLCKKANQKGIKVLIGGFGADEHFGSYKTFQQRMVRDNQLIDGRIFNNKKFLTNSNHSKKYSNKVVIQNFYQKKMNYFLNIKIPRSSLMCDRFSMSNSLEFRNPFLDKRIYNFINEIDYEYIKKNQKKIILTILNSKGLFRAKYNKNYIQSPQSKYVKQKKIIKFLMNIIYDVDFNNNFDFLKINSIIKNINNNQILAWQVMNIYIFFNSFKEFLELKNINRGKKIFNELKNYK